MPDDERGKVCADAGTSCCLNNNKIRANFVQVLASVYFDDACYDMKASPACLAGLYLDSDHKVHSCPAGFYCPSNVQCFMPCSAGAYCPAGPRASNTSSWSLEKKARHAGCANQDLCCVREAGLPSAPAVQNRDPTTGARSGEAWCPGMGQNDPCPEKYYCPSPVEIFTCPTGSYCRAGSVAPVKCHLSVCPEGTGVPEQNFAGFLILIVLSACAVAFVYFGPRLRTHVRRLLRIRKPQNLQRLLEDDNEDPDNGSVEEEDEGWILTEYVYEKHERKPLDAARCDFPLELEFRHVQLEIPAIHRVVLNDVSGRFKAASLTAIMGPSGCGKTTLLATMANKIYGGKVSGQLLINGEPGRSIKSFKSVMAYVPQEDVMHRSLTVREVLQYQAALRLPPSMTVEEREQKVNDVLEILDLRKVAHTRIGDEETRGISGGQRKRVNLGMELVCDPSILFLVSSGLELGAFICRYTKPSNFLADSLCFYLFSVCLRYFFSRQPTSLTPGRNYFWSRLVGQFLYFGGAAQSGRPCPSHHCGCAASAAH